MPRTLPLCQAAILLLAGCLLAPAPSALAAPKRRYPTLYERVYGSDFKSSGKNGMEDLVQALDLLSEDKMWRDISRPLDDPPLAIRRKFLGEPVAKQILALIQSATRKPLILSANHSSTEDAPEIRPLFVLVQFLRIQQYVQLADGRITDALNTTDLCLWLGRLMMGGSFGNSHIGVSISLLCLRDLGQHVEQFSARDCDLVREMCRKWLAHSADWQFNSSWYTVQAERALEKLRTGGADGGPDLSFQGFASPPPQDEAEREAIRKLTPLELNALTRRVLADVRSFNTAVQQELRKPYWVRNRTVLRPADDRPLRWLTENFLLPVDVISDHFVQVPTLIRLLDCHATVLRYRWEKNALPASLKDLDLGERAVDPFTGLSFQYRPGKWKYRLFSAGGPAGEEDPEAVEGRRPVEFTPGE